MKKIGILALALVLALGALGIGYASWTDTITIDGTVNTGDVDINVVGYSSTFVYKVPGEEPEIKINHVFNATDATTDPNNPGGNSFLVASAIAEYWGDDTVKITYTDLFPSINFVADVLLKYEGSIPVKVNVADIVINSGAWMLDLYIQPGSSADDDTVGIWISGWKSNAAGEKGDWIDYAPGMQLHDGDYILVEFHIHLPQEDALMNQSGSFTATLEVIQWNEYNNEEPNNN